MFTKEQINQIKKAGYMADNPKIDFNEETIRAIFGHEAAEDENLQRLKDYYVKTDIYQTIRSNIPLYILVGHKGVGKSALIKVLCAEDEIDGNIPLTVQPDDILSLDIPQESFIKKIRVWKDGLSSLIFNKLISSSTTKLLSYTTKEDGIKAWLDKFGEIASTFLGRQLSDMQSDYCNITNDQFSALFKNLLFKEKKVTVYLDDLDRGWKNSASDIDNMSAMLNAIRDLSRNTTNLNFRVALRSDVYYAVRTSDETTDKIDGSVIWQKWTNHEILVMLIKRIESYLGNSIDEQFLLSVPQNELKSYLDSVFVKRFEGNGHWENAPMYRVLMSLIRKRPRDLIKLCTLAARQSYLNKHNLIQTMDLAAVFSNYSNDRLTDTGNEYQSELPQVKELLLKMKPSKKELATGTPCLFTRGELLNKLEDILSMSNFQFKDGKAVTPNSLAAFMYKINFITARKDSPEGIQRIYYDENQYIYNDFTDFGYSYEIHPAYRWALQPSNLQPLFSQIELSE